MIWVVRECGQPTEPSTRQATLGVARMKLTLSNHRRLMMWVIASLLTCALMPFSAALFDSQSAAWHASAEHPALQDGEHADSSFDVSTHHPMPVSGEASLCDDEPARLPSELSSPPHGAPTLALMIPYPAAESPLKPVLSSDPRTRYPPGIRFHLSLGRIQV